MLPQMSLTNHLLIATPSIQNPDFSHTVIYVCEHHAHGTVGLIINRPMKQSLGLVFEQLQIMPTQAVTNHLPLLFGGPIQPERGFVIHRPRGQCRSAGVHRARGQDHSCGAADAARSQVRRHGAVR